MLTFPRLSALLIAAAMLSAAAARAQDYPLRPVRVVVPVAPGGLRDVIARAFAVEFQKSMGQAMVVDNRAGGGGLIAGEIVAKSAPDGYTLFMASGAEISIAPAVRSKLPYDPRADFVPITRLIDTPMLLFAASSLPAQDVKELIALARARPGSIVFGSSGPASVSHLAQELFAQRAGVTFIHVPYRGAALALGDMAGGRVSLLFTTVTSAKPLLDNGRARALGVAAWTRVRTMPAVPTLAEAGLKDVDAPVWVGVMAPRGTPAPLVSRLDVELRRILGTPEIQRMMAAHDAEISGEGPAEFGRMLSEDIRRWARVVSVAKITLD